MVPLGSTSVHSKEGTPPQGCTRTVWTRPVNWTRSRCLTPPSTPAPAAWPGSAPLPDPNVWLDDSRPYRRLERVRCLTMPVTSKGATVALT